MTKTSINLNFSRNTEDAFLFYKSVFGGEFGDGGVARYGDFSPTEGMPPLTEEDSKLIMHISLPILGGVMLMGSDAPESMGFHLTIGNNVHICLDPDSKIETKRIFDTLSKGGKVVTPLEDTFWGAYYGSCIDQFGIQWMFNCTAK